MNLQDKVKQFNRALGRRMLITLRWMFGRLPYPVFAFLKRVFFALSYPLLKKKRKLTLRNLRLAFGKEKNEEQLKEIADRCFNHFGNGMVDLIYLLDRPDMIADLVKIEGKEYLDNALKSGKGAILVSAHFGNFILMYLRMVQLGYKTNVIMRRTRDEEFEKYISEFRQQRGIHAIYDLPPRKCVQDCLRALRNNEVLFILLDQNYGSAGRVFVDFFGQKAATAAGPVIFSNRTGAPILPIFIERGHPNGRIDNHKIVIEPPLEVERGKDDEETTVLNIAKLTKIIERFIRRNPEQWGGWMHNRWKSKTIEEQKVLDMLKGRSSP